MTKRHFQILKPMALVWGVIGQTMCVSAYSPEVHNKSIVEGAKLCDYRYLTKISDSDIKSMIEGAEEPDDLGFSTLQMMKQRVEPGSYGKQRDVLPIRIAAQSIHGSPNPTRKIHTKSASDRASWNRIIRLPESELLPNRLDVEIVSYDTNQSVRNKMLLNASQFLCVSLAHISDAQSARKFGNFMHMIADTYSASHVQRSEPVGNPRKCETSKIEWHFSMDLVSWKQHRPADLNVTDWRFNCLTKHTAGLMYQWSKSRRIVKAIRGAKQKQVTATSEVRKTLKTLCTNILREDADTLRKPAGGASAHYSSASGTDYWRLFSKKRPDLAIQPIGLTSISEANAYYKSVAAKLKAAGEVADFTYPSRAYPDFCRNILSKEPLKPPLRCTISEINLAMKNSPKVETMWIPGRELN